MKKKKRKIYDESKVDEHLVDPTGFTIWNNPHPSKFVKEIDEDNMECYFEYDEKGLYKKECHCCLYRALSGSGNCQDGGPYFQCMPRRLKERAEKKQVTLDIYD